MSADAPLVVTIDDEDSIRAFLADALDALGYAQRGFSSASEAFEGLADAAPALFVLDITIPGEDVHATLAGLRQRWPQARVLVSSGVGASDEAEALLEAGADAFLAKPYRLRALRKQLVALLM